MAKKMKSLLPKRIGKVKVGKSVRKGALADVLASKAGQALIAEAVLAAGAMAGAKLKTSRKVHGAIAGARTKGGKAARDARAATATLTYALGEAVRSFSAALHQPAAQRTHAADGPSWASPKPSPQPKRPHAKPPAAPPA